MEYTIHSGRKPGTAGLALARSIIIETQHTVQGLRNRRGAQTESKLEILVSLVPSTPFR